MEQFGSAQVFPAGREKAAALRLQSRYTDLICRNDRYLTSCFTPLSSCKVSTRGEAQSAVERAAFMRRAACVLRSVCVCVRG